MESAAEPTSPKPVDGVRPRRMSPMALWYLSILAPPLAQVAIMESVRWVRLPLPTGFANWLLPLLVLGGFAGAALAIVRSRTHALVKVFAMLGSLLLLVIGSLLGLVFTFRDLH